MIPSSRTPEGEPLRCQVCGQSQNVEVSRPPGDAVCPSCGAHVWMPQPTQSITDGIEATKVQIRAYVAELSALCRKDPPVNDLGELAVSGLNRCLAAYGSMLWLTDKRRWWSFRATLNLIACVGETDSPDFAQEVATEKQEIVRNARIAGRETLVIGVPVMRHNRVLGVIEVLQRAGGPEITQRGYVRFVNQMADIMAGRASLSP